MRRVAVVAILLSLVPVPTFAEIFKLAVPQDPGFRLYWWPVVKIPAGWEHNENVSREAGVNMLVPVGEKFADAPSVIYARADYKPRLPEVRSIAEYVERDRQDLASESPDTLITALEAVQTADGKSLAMREFVIPARKQWEVVAYGEEGEFYLLFTLSATSEAALKAALPVYYEMLHAYSERP